MRNLIKIREDLHKALEKFHSLKTKAARKKLSEGRLRDLRRESGAALRALFKPGDIITLDHSVNYTAPSGGGWGMEGGFPLEVLSTGLTDITVATEGGQVLYIEVTEDWKRWGSDSFYAFRTALKERGQCIDRESLEHSLQTARRMLRSTLSVRNKMTTDFQNGGQHKFRDGEHYQQRLLQEINWVRGYKNALASIGLN